MRSIIIYESPFLIEHVIMIGETIQSRTNYPILLAVDQ